jgi:septal ring factor EnvC (AmiA/AmiB activator)
MAELDASHSECRNFNAEGFRLKAALDETNEQLDIVRRENKNLADEIKDLLDQLGDGGRSIHELDKQRRRLEVEKEELQAALEEAEGALEAEENKVSTETLTHVLLFVVAVSLNMNIFHLLLYTILLNFNFYNEYFSFFYLNIQTLDITLNTITV